MSNLSEFERIKILIYIGYGDKKRSFLEASNIFNENFQNRTPINLSTVYKTHKRYL